jgi:hypothetical protein
MFSLLSVTVNWDERRGEERRGEKSRVWESPLDKTSRIQNQWFTGRKKKTIKQKVGSLHHSKICNIPRKEEAANERTVKMGKDVGGGGGTCRDSRTCIVIYPYSLLHGGTGSVHTSQ